MIKLSLRKLKRDLTVGEIFAKQRKILKLSLDDVAEYVKVSRQYLQNLEVGNYAQLPATVYVKNFIKAYAVFLELDAETLIKKFENELDLYTKIHKKDGIASLTPQRSAKIKFHHFLVIPKIIKNILIVFAVSIFLTYLGLEVRKVLSPPNFSVYYPPNDFITSDPYVDISGEASKEVKILINGEEILSNRDGTFKTTINLNRGVNIITINAINKHGKESVIYRKIMVQDEV